jgi:hypothetical protein
MAVSPPGKTAVGAMMLPNRPVFGRRHVASGIKMAAQLAIFRNLLG